jgi:hypothetical protein
MSDGIISYHPPCGVEPVGKRQMFNSLQIKPPRSTWYDKNDHTITNPQLSSDIDDIFKIQNEKGKRKEKRENPICYRKPNWYTKHRHTQR